MTNEQRQRLVEWHKDQARTEWPRQQKFRAWYEGRFWDQERRKERDLGMDDTRGAEFETPYTYAYIQTMIANIVPTNPQVTVKALRKGREDARKAREALANDVLVDDSAHTSLWKLCTLAALDGAGFVKAMWSEKLGRPTFRVLSKQQVWFDETAERWEDARYAIEKVQLTRAEFEERSQPRKSPRGRPKRPLYNPKVAEGVTYNSSQSIAVDGPDEDRSQQIFEMVTVYEFYDFTSDKFYHMLDGNPEPLLEAEFPYKRLKNPYRQLMFNDNTRNLRGISDIQLIEGPQEVLNSLNAEEVRHVQAAIPVVLMDGAALQEPDQLARQLGKVRSSGEGIVVQRSTTGDRVPLREILAYTPTPTLTPSWSAMKQEAKSAISFTLAIAEYQRGGVGNSDIATELALADTSIRTLNGRRQTAVYDVVRWMGEGVIALYEQFWPMDDAGEPEVVDLMTGEEPMTFRNEDLAFGETSPEYRFRAIPYSAAENSRIVQARNMVDSLPIIQWLSALGVVDVRKWAGEFTEVYRLPDILTPPGTPPPGGAAPPTPPGPATEDTLATGALPDTAEISPAGPRVVI